MLVIRLFMIFMVIPRCYSQSNMSFFQAITDKINEPGKASLYENIKQDYPSRPERLGPEIRQLIKEQIEIYEATRSKCACEKETLIQSLVDGPVGGAIGGWVATYGSRFFEFLFCIFISYCKNRNNTVV